LNISSSDTYGAIIARNNSLVWYAGRTVTGQRLYIGGSAPGDSNTFLPSDRYAFICVTWDGTTIRYYFNGIPDGTATNTLSAFNTTPISIGRYQTGEYFQGKINSIGIYNRALTAAEISQNYYGGDIVTDGLVFALDAGNLVSYESGSTTTYPLTGSLSGSLLNGTGYSSNNGGSWNLDGTDDGIRCILNLNTSGYSAITINGWIKVTTGGTWDRWFSGTQDTSFHYPDLAILADGSIGFYHASLLTGWVNTNQQVTLNTWSYVSYVFKTSGEVIIYINGKLVFTSTYTAGTFPSNFNFMLGNRYDLNGEAIIGQISQTQIYNKALTASEIAQNFNAQRQRFGV
jgi:hypothetical protein